MSYLHSFVGLAESMYITEAFKHHLDTKSQRRDGFPSQQIRTYIQACGPAAACFHPRISFDFAIKKKYKNKSQVLVRSK